jgi:lysophospholipase L1-like esterase
VDVCSRLREEHFADELHPNEEGARIIAEEVYRVLAEAGLVDEPR